MKFLYLDDENTAQTKNFAELLKRSQPDLDIELSYPVPFTDQIKALKSMQSELDGLILDLRLDMVFNDKRKADYRALTLAQEYRTRITEGIFKAIPIILCSTDDRLNKSYKKDESGHDLFDMRYLKTEFVREADRVARECLSLASGYKKIIQIKSKISSRGEQLPTFFNLKPEQLNGVDKRLLNFFGVVDGKMPEHEYARLLLKEMILVPGVLIDEKLLAVRLGIDIEKSSDWVNLKNSIADAAAYTGPFSEGWDRYWMHLILKWWFNVKNFPANLSFLTAKERVNVITKNTKFKNLVPIMPYKKNYSDRLWVICKALDIAIDPVDGFVIDGKIPHPWQDKEYISIHGAIKRVKFKEGIRVHPLEEERFKELKKDFKA